MSSWRDELSDFLEKEHNDCLSSEGALVEEFTSALFNFMNLHIKKAFIAGHKWGSTSVYQQLPESFRDKYDYDPDIDKHWAEKGYESWVRE